jgi:superfamily II DNA or RNA helicase
MAANLKIANDYTWLQTDQEWIKEVLFQKLRFRKKDYFHNPLYRQKIWDGFINFFGKTTGRFQTGLLPEVELALTKWNIQYTKEDHRNIVDFRVESIDANFLNQFLPASGVWPDGNPAKPIELYDFQVDLTNQAIRHKRGVIQAPTGAGKTNVMICLIQALKAGTPVLFLSDSKDLIVQNYEELLKWGVPNVGILGAGYKKPNIITCSTVDSLHHIDRLLPHIKVLLVDEVHLQMSAVPMAAYKKMKNASVRLGISATPFKFAEKDKVQKWSVKGYFGPIFLTNTTQSGRITTLDLQRRGILSKDKCTFFHIKEPQLPWDVFNDAVTNGIANNWHFHQVIKGLCNTLKGRTVVLVERLAQGDALHKLMPNSVWVQGKDNKTTRKWVIKQLKESKKDVIAIFSQKLMTTGINVFVHNIVNAAGGKADHEIIQRIGRGLRTAEDKDILNYYDFIFLINQYLEDHSYQRVKILRDEGHDVVVEEAFNFAI